MSILSHACIVVVTLLLFAQPATGQFLARFTNPKVDVTLTHPPGFPIEFDRAAILPRGGECSEEFGDSIIESFLNNGVELVDRQHIERIFAEHDLASTGRVDVETAAELGRILGPSVLIFAKVQRCALDQRRLTDKGTTLDGDPVVKFISKTEGHFRASLRVVDLATASIFTAKTITTQMEQENASYEGYLEHPSEFEVQDAMLGKAVHQVHKMFFPWNERRELYFFNDDECNLRAAYKLLKIDDAVGALETSKDSAEHCKTADVKPKFKSRAFYNLGMAHFILGHYDEALEHLETAYRMDGGNIVSESIGECRRAQRLAEEMAEIDEVASFEPPAVRQAEAGEDLGVATANAEKTGSGDTIESRLEKLKSLFENDLISREEYDEKRAEILSDI